MSDNLNTAYASKTVPFRFGEKEFLIACGQEDSVYFIWNEVFVSQQYLLVPIVNAPKIVFDIGANIGCTTLWFTLHYPDAVIYSFEPHPQTFQYLVANTKHVSNVHNFGFGLLNCESRQKLFIHNNTSATSSIGQSVHNTKDFVLTDFKSAATFCLDSGIDRIDVLKVDTEGCELFIIKDLIGLINDTTQVIYVEYHSEQDRRELDEVLGPHFIIFGSSSRQPHRGLLVYVRESLVQNDGYLSKLAIRIDQL